MTRDELFKIGRQSMLLSIELNRKAVIPLLHAKLVLLHY